MPFDADWLFRKGNEAGAREIDFDDRHWRRLNVPHDWSIEEPFDPDMAYGGCHAYLPRYAIAWYRKRFRLAPELQGRRVWIRFDGVHHNSEVWLNGYKVGHRPYGYVPFQLDLTPHLRGDGENVLAVRVDNTVMPPDRWYSGSGIYRRVRLIAVDPLHADDWDTFIITPAITAEEALVKVRTTVRNLYGDGRQVTVATEIFDPEGVCAGRAETALFLSAGESRQLTLEIRVPRPRLWSPDHPALYAAYTTVACDGRIVDDLRTTFGIRDIRFDQNRAFSSTEST